MAKITITPSSQPKKSIVHIDTPIYIRKSEDGKFYANITVLGGIKTYGENEADLDIAIQEALKFFFSFANQYGKGIHQELKSLGWTIKNNGSMKYSVNHKSKPIIELHPEGYDLALGLTNKSYRLVA